MARHQRSTISCTGSENRLPKCRSNKNVVYSCKYHSVCHLVNEKFHGHISMRALLNPIFKERGLRRASVQTQSWLAITLIASSMEAHALNFCLSFLIFPTERRNQHPIRRMSRRALLGVLYRRIK